MRKPAGITVPIRKLAEGTVEVARGNLGYRIEDLSGDEVGMLVTSFNRMTADLKDSSERLQQESANREIILANIDAGVVSIDRGGRITTINPAMIRTRVVGSLRVIHAGAPPGSSPSTPSNNHFNGQGFSRSIRVAPSVPRLALPRLAHWARMYGPK